MYNLYARLVYSIVSSQLICLVMQTLSDYIRMPNIYLLAFQTIIETGNRYSPAAELYKLKNHLQWGQSDSKSFSIKNSFSRAYLLKLIDSRIRFLRERHLSLLILGLSPSSEWRRWEPLPSNTFPFCTISFTIGIGKKSKMRIFASYAGLPINRSITICPT